MIKYGSPSQDGVPQIIIPPSPVVAPEILVDGNVDGKHEERSKLHLIDKADATDTEQVQEDVSKKDEVIEDEFEDIEYENDSKDEKK